MSTFTATLFIETNPLSREKLACGLLAVTPERVFFDWAAPKVKLAEAQASEEYKGYFQQRLRMIAKSLREEDQKYGPQPRGQFNDLLSQSHFERLQQYNAGPIQFGDIKPHSGSIDKEAFEKLFKDFIHPSVSKHRGSGSGLYRAVYNKLDRPAIQAKADVNYELPEDRIDGLIYDAHVTMITVNGSIQPLQTVDMSKGQETVVRHLNESEMIYNQLCKLGKKMGKDVAKLKVVYGNAPGIENSELVRKVREEKSDVFDLMSMPELDAKILKMEVDPAYQRFSEFLK
ncbi:MAG: hypothetical protein KA817_08155 [Flavobacteriales bacterium]|nr:hypothetical protein [Flavobacteriales bacterium]